MTSPENGNTALFQAGRPLRCWLLALLTGWVTMVFMSSVLIVVRGIPNAMTQAGVGSPGWIAAIWRVADEMAPTAKLLLVALFAVLLWLTERWLPARVVEAPTWPLFLRNIVMGGSAMILTLALIPTDLSRGFGVGLTGARFDPLVMPLYLVSAVVGAIVYTVSVGRCRRAQRPSSITET